MKNMTFDLVFEPEETGGFTVTAPALPECVTYGETFEEANTNAREAVLLCLEDRQARGENLTPLSHRTVLSSVDFSLDELQYA